MGTPLNSRRVQTRPGLTSQQRDSLRQPFEKERAGRNIDGTRDRRVMAIA